MEHFLSIIIPVYNEEENLENLNTQIFKLLEGAGLKYEIIYVNDGSTDRSIHVLKEISVNEHVKIIDFTRNFGQTQALQAGIDEACGDVIIPMDADLQNDPLDILKMLELYDKGFDIVSGWRKNRHDNIIRVIPSKIANSIICALTGIKLHDFGCTLKIYNAKLLKKIRLYGELHRFIPVAVSIFGGGANFVEVEVNHHKRIHGKSKYNMTRTFRVILDLFTLVFFQRFIDRPMYFFGGCSLILFLISLFVLILTLLNTSVFSFIISFITGCFFFGLAFLALLIGLIADLLMRTYFESSGKKVYNIKEIL